MNSGLTFVFLIVLVVLVSQTIQTYLKNRNKQPPINEELENTIVQIDKLEERIRVLERIVTESRFDLKKEIDSL